MPIDAVNFIFINLRGPSEVVDTACSSTLVAMHRVASDDQRVQRCNCWRCELSARAAHEFWPRKWVPYHLRVVRSMPVQTVM